MSNFQCKVKIKKTGEIVNAFAIDDYFGRHQYAYEVGDKFYREDEVEIVDERINNMQTLKKLLEEFDEKFPCIQSDCDGTGNIPVSRSVDRQISDTEWVEDVEWVAEQCEFHYKYLLPIKDFISQSIKTALESVVMKEKHCGGDLQMNDEYEQCKGWNACREQLLKNKEDYLKE